MDILYEVEIKCTLFIERGEEENQKIKIRAESREQATRIISSILEHIQETWGD